MKPTVLEHERAVEAQTTREVVTPEGIPIRFQLARAGDRAAAFLLDAVIQIGVVLAIALVLAAVASASRGLAEAFVTIAIFLVLQFYFVFFEVRWQGATPGKRSIGIRVIDARGGQLETRAVLARNFVRQLELWMPVAFLVSGRQTWPDAPGWAYVLAGLWTFVFLLFPLFNRDRLRFGDLVAGTRVVRYPKAVLMPELVDEPPARGFAFSEAQLGVYGIYELQVLEGVLRQPIDQPGHPGALATVADKIRHKIGYEPSVTDDERFLRDFYAALRAHLEQRMLFGQRREDKHAARR